MYGMDSNMPGAAKEEESMAMSASATTPLNAAMPDEDRPVKHRSVKNLAISLVSQVFFDRLVYTVRNGLNKGQKRKGGLAWLPAWFPGNGETTEGAFWRRYAEQGKLDNITVVEIGAHDGRDSLFLARHASRVFAFEPLRSNYRRLCRNAELNGYLGNRIQPRKYAVGSRAETLQMNPGGLFSGCARLARTGNQGESVDVVTIDEMLAGGKIASPQLIRIDVEGAEGAVLKGASFTLRQHHPEVFVEIHGDTLREKRRTAAEVVLLLEEAGFTDILHVETGTKITSANAGEIAYQGHLLGRWPISGN
jgi:FkbM family methyltransferase